MRVFGLLSTPDNVDQYKSYYQSGSEFDIAFLEPSTGYVILMKVRKETNQDLMGAELKLLKFSYDSWYHMYYHFFQMIDPQTTTRTPMTTMCRACGKRLLL